MNPTMKFHATCEWGNWLGTVEFCGGRMCLIFVERVGAPHVVIPFIYMYFQTYSYLDNWSIIII